MSLFPIQPKAGAHVDPGVPGGENPALEAGLQALRDGDPTLAITLLRSSAGEDSLSAEAWLGLGVAYGRLGRSVPSLEAYGRSEEGLSEPLLGWVRFVHARELVEAGRIGEADSLLALVAALSATRPLQEQLHDFRLDIATESGDEGAVRALLEESVRSGRGDAAASALRLAEMAQPGDESEALRLRRAALTLPGNDESRGRSAREILDSGESLSSGEALRAGRTLFGLADWEGAERAFRMALESAGTPEQRAEAMYRLGLSLLRKRSYSEASRYLTEVEGISGRYRTSAAYYSAIAIVSSSSRQTGAAALVEFADRYPRSRWAPRALKEAADRLAEVDYDLAREVFSRLVREHPTYWENAAILFELGSSARRSGDLEEAEGWFAELGSGVFHPHEKAQGWFWAARVADSAGDSASSATYLSRAAGRYPYTFYGARALQELGQPLPEPVAAPHEMTEGELLVPGWAGPTLSAGVTLLRVGLTGEGESQLIHAIEERVPGVERLYALWTMCIEGRAFRAAKTLGERLLRYGGLDEEDRRFWALNYPPYYSDIIVTQSRQFDLDPYLVLALIKQESAFWPDARSYAGARGLMQLMPVTAQEWRRRLRLPPVEDIDLYDPGVNLQLGIPYLAHLVEQFDGSVEKALAAYNGGPTNVRRWERGLIDEKPETFVESIGFSETRTFVRTILNNYYRYRFVWSRMNVN